MRIQNDRITEQQALQLNCLIAYAHQLKLFSKDDALNFFNNNQDQAETVLDMFDKKFNLNTPLLQEDFAAEESSSDITKNLIGIINATERTNAFKTDRNQSIVAIKVSPAKLHLPSPSSLLAEIFVYSEEFEGIHLRAGRISRGGLRWSSRSEDFRDEIMGLVMTQILKNVVIVPNGSKGGFVLKKASPENVVECYKNFLRNLLELTDNIVKGEEVAATGVKSYDDIDTYLVVAADKGTGSFSDYANEVAEEYNFWLGDAFASGGTKGYGHKDLGITAKGSWESVKRSLKEMNIDTQQDRFNVVGIGSMNGDVFGNGMLLSDKIALVAAFNNNSLFIDPKPDLEVSYNERKRLFEAEGGSSWLEYNVKCISEGGGVFSRDDESIEINPQIRKMLSISANIKTLSANQVIKMLLKSPNIDLLWNGGIGTYIKSCSQSHSKALDSANDHLRIDGYECKIKTIGEGGNLGLTQKGRVEYNLTHGSSYTDALDNSAGVSCSDHEVNIKILLKDLIDNGVIKSSERSDVIHSLTSEVVDNVLKDNILQGQLVSATHFSNPRYYTDAIANLIKFLEKNVGLNRINDCIPTEQEIAYRKESGVGFVKPEIAVIVSYVKMYFSEVISNMDSDFFEKNSLFLFKYFPKSLLNEANKPYMLKHKLNKEIITAQIANAFVNFVGLVEIGRFVDSGINIEEFIKHFSYLYQLSEYQKVSEFFSKDHYECLSIYAGYKLFNRSNATLALSIAIAAQGSISNFDGKVNFCGQLCDKYSHVSCESNFGTFFSWPTEMLLQVTGSKSDSNYGIVADAFIRKIIDGDMLPLINLPEAAKLLISSASNGSIFSDITKDDISDMSSKDLLSLFGK